MSVTKEIIEMESARIGVDSEKRGEVHLWKEGTFLRAYDWSAWLACRYLHEFKVNKRSFKGISEPVAYIGFPETSLVKWLPEGAEQLVEGEKHLVLRLPEVMLADTPEVMAEAYTEWKDALPLTEAQPKERGRNGRDAGDNTRGVVTPPTSLTTIMQRILAWPIENRSLMDNTRFLSDIRRQLAALV